MLSEEFGERSERGSVLRLLGPLAPEGVRRAHRMERLAEEISRAAMRGGAGRVPDGFDPNLGASGRLPVVYEHRGGPRTRHSKTVTLNRAEHWGQTLGWNGSALTVEEAHRGGSLFTLPLARAGAGAPRRGRGGVTEAALFVSGWGWVDPHRYRDTQTPPIVRHGSLHFLDARGYALLVVCEIWCAWREIAQVVKAAGVPFVGD